MRRRVISQNNKEALALLPGDHETRRHIVDCEDRSRDITTVPLLKYLLSERFLSLEEATYELETVRSNRENP